MAFESLLDTREPVRRLLDGLQRGVDVHVIAQSVHDLNPRHNTFPGEVYLRVGAAALDAANVAADRALEQEQFLSRYLPEAQFRGRQNHRITYALMAPAAWRGGFQVDLLDEVAYWPIEDYWRYQLMATVALIRGCAERTGEPVVEFAERVLAPFLA